MKIIAYTMQYSGKVPAESSIHCIPYDGSYFAEYMKKYNECFREMRKALEIEPFDYLSSPQQIRDRQDSIFLLLEDGRIAGSVACYGNEIDDLIVSKEYQGRGYGKELLLWAMNRIRQSNDDPITLHVAEWNEKAVNLYRKSGFSTVKTECVRE